MCALPVGGFEFIMSENIIYRVNNVTGEMWALDKNSRTWIPTKEQN